jgi:hypothetical protein
MGYGTCEILTDSHVHNLIVDLLSTADLLFSGISWQFQSITVM